ncbi:class II fructose-bisphosphate aldolase [Plantactinospora sonchi]|uniref:Fructose-bisphosphate aldolase n=1 Tax=Plantactinospora sonchi TaxID=1544735 RepID=A0ABU7S4U5_9ACTN
MPVATPALYREMLDRAKQHHFAYPAVNVRSSTELHGALSGFAEAASDGIIQVTVRGAEFWSGSTVMDGVRGATAFADFARAAAEGYPTTVALHTDHCPSTRYESFLLPLIHASQQRVSAGDQPLFQSYMWDGSALPLARNLELSRQLLDECAKAEAVLEIEIGVIGEEPSSDPRLYSTVEDASRVVTALGDGDRGRYLVAAAFGNVHGVYRPAEVRLRPELLGEIQRAVGSRIGRDRPFDFVFHGGSGASQTDVATAVSHGVVKMNLDTDTQYAFTRAIADYLFRRYDRVLRIDGDLGDKSVYGSRGYLEKAEGAMAARVRQACVETGSAGTRPAP